MHNFFTGALLLFFAQVTELWTQYGNLTEIWVDSGTDGLDDLMNGGPAGTGWVPKFCDPQLFQVRAFAHNAAFWCLHSGGLSVNQSLS